MFPALLKPESWSCLSAESSLTGQALVFSQQAASPAPEDILLLPRQPPLLFCLGPLFSLSHSLLSCQRPLAPFEIPSPSSEADPHLSREDRYGLRPPDNLEQEGTEGTAHLPGGAGTGLVLSVAPAVATVSGWLGPGAALGSRTRFSALSATVCLRLPLG